MNLVVVGSGYVGLVSGACLADKGHRVICVDISEERIAGLKRGEVPIYEPGLDAIIARNADTGALSFTTSLPEAMREADIFCIAVGTPPDEDGSADLRHVLAVAREIGQHMERPALIINKSTVPVGTAEKVRAAVDAELAARGVQIEYDVASNPEFLKEGMAIEDFMQPDRIIVGVDSPRARQLLDDLYEPFVKEGARLIHMGVRDAEMAKYAANAMLATRISFMNEIAGLCERLGVDVEHVRLGISTDPRIGDKFLRSGAGYGGSCLPKDVQALASMARSVDFEPMVLNAVERRNQVQKQWLFEKLVEEFGPDMKGRTIALWGLAFKPGTDDMREAPSITLVESLLKAGAQVRAYDPETKDTAPGVMPRCAGAGDRMAAVPLARHPQAAQGHAGRPGGGRPQHVHPGQGARAGLPLRERRPVLTLGGSVAGVVATATDPGRLPGRGLPRRQALRAFGVRRACRAAPAG